MVSTSNNITEVFNRDYAYQQRIRTFPSDIFASFDDVDLGVNGAKKNHYHGHWMLININVQDSSNFDRVTRNGISQSIYPGVGPNFTRTDQYSRVDNLRLNIDNQYRGNNNAILRNSPSFTNFLDQYITRRTKRIVESIAIYMPNTMQFSQANAYEDVSLTEFVFGKVANMSTSIGQGLAKVTGTSAGARLGRGAGGLLGGAAGATGGVGRVAQVAGAPINPKVEVLFSNVGQREFQFDFLMAPSNEQESEAIRNIHRTIRFHGAPEVNTTFGGGEGLLGLGASFFWVPPSEFDITFFYKDKENTTIPRISTLALINADLDFAPTGVWATFSNGHPVQVRMQLRFRETEPITKLRVSQGF